MIQEVFEAFLADPVKRIDAGDLTWAVKPNHAGHFHFRAAVRSDHATDIFVEGSWNPKKEKVNFTIWQTPGAPAGVRGAGKRLYSLDVGPRHRKPDGTLSARTHRHRWDAALAGKPKPGDRGRYRGDEGAYDPTDITASGDRPGELWAEFLAEAKLIHDGMLIAPGGGAAGW